MPMRACPNGHDFLGLRGAEKIIEEALPNALIARDECVSAKGEEDDHKINTL